MLRKVGADVPRIDAQLRYIRAQKRLNPFVELSRKQSTIFQGAGICPRCYSWAASR